MAFNRLLPCTYTRPVYMLKMYPYGVPQALLLHSMTCASLTNTRTTSVWLGTPLSRTVVLQSQATSLRSVTPVVRCGLGLDGSAEAHSRQRSASCSKEPNTCSGSQPKTQSDSANTPS